MLDEEVGERRVVVVANPDAEPAGEVEVGLAVDRRAALPERVQVRDEQGREVALERVPAPRPELVEELWGPRRAVGPVVVLERVLVQLAAVLAKQVHGVGRHHVLVEPAQRRRGRIGVVRIDRQQSARIGVGNHGIEVGVLAEPVQRVRQLAARTTPEAEQQPAPRRNRPVHQPVAPHRAGEVDGRPRVECRGAADRLRGCHRNQRLVASHVARVRRGARELGRSGDLTRAVGRAPARRGRCWAPDTAGLDIIQIG